MSLVQPSSPPGAGSRDINAAWKVQTQPPMAAQGGKGMGKVQLPLHVPRPVLGQATPLTPSKFSVANSRASSQDSTTSTGSSIPKLGGSARRIAGGLGGGGDRSPVIARRGLEGSADARQNQAEAARAGAELRGRSPWQSATALAASAEAVARPTTPQGHFRPPTATRSASSNSQSSSATAPVPSGGGSAAVPVAAVVTPVASSSSAARALSEQAEREEKDAHSRSLDSKVEALKDAFERSVQLVKRGPLLGDLPSPRQQSELLGLGMLGVGKAGSNFDAKSVGSCDESVSSLALGDEQRTRSDEMHRTLIALQKSLEQQHVQQRTKLAQLSERWEARFAQLEKSLSTGLETATAATTSMNERLAKFMTLAGVLEGAVQRVVQSDREVEALSSRAGRIEELVARKVAEIEGDVACLAQELANDRLERSANPAAPGKTSSAPERLHSARSDVEHLAKELTNERAERLQLALDVQATRCDMERLQALLDTANDQLASLSRELSPTDLSPSKTTGLQQEQKESWSVQLESLRREIHRGSSSKSKGSSRESRRAWFGSSRIERIEEEEEQQVTEALDGDTGSDANQRPSFGNSAANVPRGWGYTEGL